MKITDTPFGTRVEVLLTSMWYSRELPEEQQTALEEGLQAKLEAYDWSFDKMLVVLAYVDGFRQAVGYSKNSPNLRRLYYLIFTAFLRWRDPT